MRERLEQKFGEQKDDRVEMPSAEQIRLLKSEEYKTDFDALRTRLGGMQKEGPQPIPLRRVQAPSGDIKPVPFPEILYADKDIDPGFSRSTAEMFKRNEFIEEIGRFCKKYGLAVPYFTNVKQAISHIESEKKKILGISRRAEGKREPID
ncbi:MAG: hypothetical protein A3B10_00890 [Candidatus Doudnabacteria bacterium RIFCSPLOWO2_01_FULL_44_21]|uniref:Uncharacterized protein n=1 Tax=Candidatus Doudnabacteria bacterium RIFCSPLOWO2_01_FULL_44_21 TaxID=1817841 RepID=A0A1F5PX70_9BACT|nr:MAG: hypothetical protein A3B10_00890 [Candidatus Doudnabacteria bacterium RIFCSPLOWO2_01_FULL_44_21]